MIVARHEVPGKRPPKEPSPRVRYVRAPPIQEVFLVESAFRTDVRAALRCDGTFLHTEISSVFTSETSSFQYCNHRIKVRTPARIRPYPTGRLFWGGTFPGTSCQATIILSLRNKSHSPMGSFIKLALMRFNSGNRPKQHRALNRRQTSLFKIISISIWEPAMAGGTP
jgi:hypothetical protein